MRLRALVFLVMFTAGDYLLWDWSIADGHDILSLVAGLTLLPLAAVSLGGLVLAGARLLGWLFGRPSYARAERAWRETGPPAPMQDAEPAKSDSSSGKLAA